MNAHKILIVDDNAMNVELMSCVLEDDVFNVESASDAKEALARIDSFVPDLILMDMHLPGMDGLQLTRFIKSNLALRHIVIIAFTASAMKGDEAKMLNAGCDGYLSKPIDVDTIAATILTFLPGSASGAAG